MKSHTPEGQRLIEVIKYSGEGNVEAFARKIGIGNLKSNRRGEALRRVMRGENKLSDKIANKIIEHYPKFNKGWLLTGTGYRFNRTKNDDFKDCPYCREKDKIVKEQSEIIDFLRKKLIKYEENLESEPKTKAV